MTRVKNLSHNLVMQMRDDGRAQDDCGVFEIDLIEHKITWVNNYAVGRIGYTPEQIKYMSLFDVIPESFRSQMQNAMIEASERETEEKEGVTIAIWPTKSSTGKIIWWATVKSFKEYPTIWIYGDHIQTTGSFGTTYAFMNALMRAANGQFSIHGKLSEFKSWMSDNISRLDEEDKRIKVSVSNLEMKIDDSLEASERAAKISKETYDVVEMLRRSFQEFETKYGAEILKLIGTDTIHDKRIDAFERHVEMTTDLAMKSITLQAKNSSDGLVKQAEESSKGLSKKVVIPVSVIATIVTIIQILVERFFR